MDLNFIVFPAPRCTYTSNENVYPLIWIPKYKSLYPSFQGYRPVKQQQSNDLFSNNPPFYSQKDEDDIPKIDLNDCEDMFNKRQEIPNDQLKQAVKFEQNIETQYESVSTKMYLVNLKQKIQIQSQIQDEPFGYIPCIPYLIIYFHGNGEDINLSQAITSQLRKNLEITIISMEYPGYGIYTQRQSTSESILDDAQYLYQYCIHQLNYQENNIIIFGRSIGSGPATYVASLNNPACLTLISPFTSLRAVVRDYIGNWAQYLIRERFENFKVIDNVKCPLFIIHGQKDSLIPFQQALQLHCITILINPLLKEKYKGVSEIQLPQNMTHVIFDFYRDIIEPFYKFLENINFQVFNRQGQGPQIRKELFIKPHNY